MSGGQEHLRGWIWSEARAGGFRARVSNLSYYAATGVKAQAIVLVLFQI
jgi:hypothetical protein